MEHLLVKAAIALFSNRPKPILDYLKKHFGRDPRKYPIVQTEFSPYRKACVYLALQRYLARKHSKGMVLGLSTTSDNRFGDLLHPDSYVQQTAGPVQYENVTLSDGRNLSCAQQAIYLVRTNQGRFAVLLSPTWRHDERNVMVEVMAKDRKIAEDFLAELRLLADAHSIYRGQVICMKEVRRDLTVCFQNVPAINRSQVILPNGVLQEIERHTSGFSNHRNLLLSRGRHLKRGLLLYGPPGTGKSLTIMYLLTQMPNRTTVLLSGRGVQHVEDACALARSLQPATVVIEDVDLVAEERTRMHHNPLLFELMNQMDGIADDADVLFLLSTNRPEILEPALASRPGRIDQAIMIPLPDEDCRTRLFELYAKELPVAVNDMSKFVQSTEGASAAFIRELFRKAALFAIEEGPEVYIQEWHLAQALELLRSSLTGRLLGCEPKPEHDAGLLSVTYAEDLTETDSVAR